MLSFHPCLCPGRLGDCDRVNSEPVRRVSRPLAVDYGSGPSATSTAHAACPRLRLLASVGDRLNGMLRSRWEDWLGRVSKVLLPKIALLSSPVPSRQTLIGALDVSNMCDAAADLRDPEFMHGVAPGQPAPCASACRRHPCSLSRCMIIFAFPGRTHTVGTFVLAVAGDKLSQPLICFERLPFSIVYLS